MARRILKVGLWHSPPHSRPSLVELRIVLQAQFSLYHVHDFRVGL